MKRIGIIGILAGVCAVAVASSQAEEPTAKPGAGHEQAEHEAAGDEHDTVATTPQAAPTMEQVRQAITDYVGQTEREEGAFTMEDDVTGTTRTLTLVSVHDQLGKTGETYYACTDMRDTASGEQLDLDFDVESENGQLEVVDVRIHKVNGQARYTYDDQANRLPL